MAKRKAFDPRHSVEIDGVTICGLSIGKAIDHAMDSSTGGIVRNSRGEAFRVEPHDRSIPSRAVVVLP